MAIRRYFNRNYADFEENLNSEVYVDKSMIIKELLEDTWQHKEDDVVKAIEEVHQENVSILKYNNENSLSCVIH